MTAVLFEERVKESLDRSVAAFNQGQPEFFEEFADDAMIITADSNEPITGREAYRQRYQSALTSQKREKTILNRHMQILDEKAVVTQTARIKEGNTVADVLQTIVYGLTNEGVKVMHLHNAPLTLHREGLFSSPVQVVNEKIAPVASVFGVAQ